MSEAELTEVSRIIVVGRDWKEKEAEPRPYGLRGHQRFLANLTTQQRKEWELSGLL